MRLLSSLLLTAAAVQAHYHFPRMVVNGQAESADWQAVRQTKNYQSNAGISDVSSGDMRCYQMAPGRATVTVAAGTKLGFQAVSEITHFGPLQFYMAKVPEGSNINTWDASGSVWFKVAKIDAVRSGKGFDSTVTTWPALGAKVVDFTVPTSLPSGKYLVRVESIALHQASGAGGAQIYISCGQVEVTGGGSGTPGPTVAFPGAYRSGEAGLIWSYYPVKTSYTAPGPSVWQG